MEQSEKILNSINSLERAEAPGSFYAGIRAKMQRRQAAPAGQLVLRPAYLIPVLFIFLAINITLLTRGKGSNTETNNNGAQTFAAAYNLSTPKFGE